MKKTNKTPVGVVLWLVLSCAFHIVLFRGKPDMNMPVIQRLLFVVLAIVITLPLHEVIHFVCMKLFGLTDAQIEFAIDPLGLPSMRTISQGTVHGWKRAVIRLAPFTLLTVIPDILFCLNEQVHLLFLIIAMCNAAGCCFDAAEVAKEISKPRIEG